MKVGDYVRTVGGLIGKVIEKKGNAITYFIPNSQEDDVIDVIKSSPNIIDLIEVGDYVNGIYIEGNKGRYLETLEHDIENSSLGHIEYLKIYPNDIKSIVTKEQFSSMQYEVN